MFRCIFSADFRHTLKVAGKVDIKKNDRFFVLHLPEGDECIISPGDEVKRIGSFTSEVKAVSHSRPGVFFVDIDRASTISSGKKAVYLRCGATVGARGRHLKLVKDAINIHKPVVIKYHSKKQSMDITVHSLRHCQC